ncbi:hypothetical protein L218DRAFT_949410 [Marasmius fiardii PR-910]|nr:hypothetical protein L218DRAFT_949410 [Marasmius fiardii PR-910]
MTSKASSPDFGNMHRATRFDDTFEHYPVAVTSTTYPSAIPPNSPNFRRSTPLLVLNQHHSLYAKHQELESNYDHFSLPLETNSNWRFEIVGTLSAQLKGSPYVVHRKALPATILMTRERGKRLVLEREAFDLGMVKQLNQTVDNVSPSRQLRSGSGERALEAEAGIRKAWRRDLREMSMNDCDIVRKAECEK